jgi:ElaB/YqjD/DUF883 family membrane-anchored ribosome-binding protein
MNEPNSRDYARDAEAARTRLSEKLSELHDGLTPGRLLDEVLSYGRNGGTFFLKALNNAARENPVPTMLVGAGCAMFLTEKTGLMHRAGDTDDEPGSEGRARAKARSAKDNGGTLAKGLKEGTHDAAEALEDGAAKVGDVAGAMKRRVEGAVEEVGDQIADASHRAKEQASRTAGQMKDRADAFMQEQPLLAAAIGIAIGAAVAAAFPSTDLEDDVMGETSDAVKETLSEVASEQLDAAKSAASAVAEEAQSAAQREGLTPAAVADAARDLGQRVGRVVSDTADAATAAAGKGHREEG